MQHARWEGCSEPCLRNCHAHSTHHEHLNTDEEFVRISLARSWAPAALKGHVLNTSHNHPGQNQHAGCQKITKTFQQFASCCVLDRGTFTGLCERYTRSSKSINVMMRHASFSTEAHSHTKKQTSTNFSRTNSQRTKIQDHMSIIPFLPVASSDSSSRPACFSCSRSSKLPRFPALAREFARPVAFNFGFQRLIFRCLFSASVPALPLLVPARKDVAPNLDELAAVPSKYLARKRFPSS